MKKRLLFLFLLLGVIPNCFSQKYYNSVRYGIRAGINFSNLNFSIVSFPPDTPLKTEWKEGFVGGVYIIVPLRDNLYLQPEYLFSQTGGNADNRNLKFKLNYLSLPVFLRWEATNRLAFIAGPQFDLLINAVQANKENPNITAETESRSVGLAGGIDFRVINNIGIGLRYFQTAHDIWIPVGNNERQEFKHQLIQASIYYIF